MDFITGLPKVAGKAAILVVVDRLSKYAHFIALPPKFTSTSIAAIFVQEICRLHGFPKSILSDRDPLFMSHFWQEFFRLSGTHLQHTSAYHPETDGQTEVTNRGLEQYLRCFCMDRQTGWVRCLPWAELSYNTSVHSATHTSPFQTVYGRPPPPLLHLSLDPDSNSVPSSTTADRQHLLAQLKEHLREAQIRMKNNADKHRRHVEFNIGDRVVLRLQPYRQSSLADKRFSKLRRRYYGPFPIIQRIGPVAYKLELPPHARIHPVFHISKLKLFRENSSMHPEPLPPDTSNGMIILQPRNIVDRRWILLHGEPHEQVLVNWDDNMHSSDSWINIDVFRTLYPSFHLEDKVTFNEGRNDTTFIVYHRRKKSENSSTPAREAGTAARKPGETENNN